MKTPLSARALTLLYGAVHLLVDAVSVAFYFAISREEAFRGSWDIFVLYTLLAFAMQVPLGMFSDRIDRPVLTAIAGCTFVALGPFFSAFPLFALLIVCTGNALFHVGGGAIALIVSRGRAAIPGMFVAPGTIGVAIGVTLGHFGNFPHTVFCAILVVAVVLLSGTGRLVQALRNLPKAVILRDKKTSLLSSIVIPIFAVIILRAIVADYISDTARMGIFWRYALPTAVFFGKFFGGFLCDRFGWTRTVLTGLLCSAPMVCFGEKSSALLIAGAFLFTMSMPVTLAILGNLMPRQPAFAFGLTALALAIGALAARHVPRMEMLIFLAICLAACLFYFGIRRYNQEVEKTPFLPDENFKENIP